MKATTLAALALSLLAVGQVAQADTPGYDRPGPEQAKPTEHAHLVYWTTYFEHMSTDIQTLADTYSTDKIKFIGEKKAKKP